MQSPLRGHHTSLARVGNIFLYLTSLLGGGKRGRQRRNDMTFQDQTEDLVHDAWKALHGLGCMPNANLKIERKAILELLELAEALEEETRP
jgi:hypothetical protein